MAPTLRAVRSRATDLWEDVRALWELLPTGTAAGACRPTRRPVQQRPRSTAPGLPGRLALTDAEFGPALTAMLVDEGPDGVVGPVDFRSLSVREFGTIYEGLLESMLSVADSDLAVETREATCPRATAER